MTTRPSLPAGRKAPILATVRLLPGASPRLTAATGAVIVVMAVLPAGFALASGDLVGAIGDATADGWSSPAGHQLMGAIGVVVVLFLLQQICGPSGGQWQKLALARAMMRTEPLLLVLDEPTASLDAEAEHRLFERYSAAASELATRNGAITLVVSHRFSTVRMADLIVVVADGRIVEQGSHDQLIAAQHMYAELYELQAQGYR